MDQRCICSDWAGLQATRVRVKRGVLYAGESARCHEETVMEHHVSNQRSLHTCTNNTGADPGALSLIPCGREGGGGGGAKSGQEWGGWWQRVVRGGVGGTEGGTGMEWVGQGVGGAEGGGSGGGAGGAG